MASAEYAFNQRGYGTHQAMTELVEVGATVLDVGCASGYLMENLRRTKNCHCVGIEPNPVAAGRASALGFEVIPSTAIDALAAKQKSGDQFKHIIFGDVLEHMTEPQQVLERCRSLLAPNGTIIVSLPNIVSLRARVRIACGIWRYEEMGIFDRTHLRFFTIRTGRELLVEAGYAIIDERFVGPLTFLGGRRLESVTRLRPQVLANGAIFSARPILAEKRTT
jgi:2-polyprenyl-3-methyl-5-hydroxy-6-metoxy-1,4-benzoquinol methylase